MKKYEVGVFTIHDGYPHRYLGNIPVDKEAYDIVRQKDGVPGTKEMTLCFLGSSKKNKKLLDGLTETVRGEALILCYIVKAEANVIHTDEASGVKYLVYEEKGV